MSLKDYAKKRDFKKTAEPKASKSKHHSDVKIFVIQKHKASHLHYDFRLEVQGVLKSWAIPKGPSLNPKDKRLAIMVEDHPYEYKDFEGIIPEGYGAGTVMIWDKGVYCPLDENYEMADEKTLLKGLHSGKITIALAGQKLEGTFNLIKFKNSEKNEWLLIKVKDKYASTSNILDKDYSAVTGRTIEEIEAEE